MRSFDARLSDDQKSVRLRIDIEEGEPIRVERVVLTGFESLPEANRRELETRLPLKAGAPLDRALLQASREAAVDELKDHGYPHAEANVAESPGSSDRQRVVTYSAVPGRLAYVGRIEIAGTASVDDRIVRRQLTFRPGQLFQQSKLRESQRRLYSMELFNFVNVEAVTAVDIATASAETEGAENAADRIPTRVTVTEGKHRKVNFGAGYGTTEKLRGEIDWRHVNFFGGARTAGVFARYSAIDRGVRLNLPPALFLQPEVLVRDERADVVQRRAGVQAHDHRRPRHDRARVHACEIGSRPAADDHAGAHVRQRVGGLHHLQRGAQRSDVPRRADCARARSPHRDRPRPAGRRYCSTPAATRPTTCSTRRRGYVASVHFETAGQWLGGDFDYREVSAEGRYYQAIGSRAVVARARPRRVDQLVRARKRSSCRSSSATSWAVRPTSRMGPLRGVAAERLGPADRRPHLRELLDRGRAFPHRSATSARVLFLDGGNVWTNPWDFNLNDLRYDVGPGLRYNTPIGPVRLDVGCQLNPIPGSAGERRSRRSAPCGRTSASARRSDSMALIRRSVHVVAWLGTLAVVLLSVALIVSQTPWFRDWIRRAIIREAKQYLNGELTHRSGHRQPVLRFRSVRRRRRSVRRPRRRRQGDCRRLQRLHARLPRHRHRSHHADGTSRAPRSRRRGMEHPASW